jgi:hypothetical protein
VRLEDAVDQRLPMARELLRVDLRRQIFDEALHALIHQPGIMRRRLDRAAPGPEHRTGATAKLLTE